MGSIDLQLQIDKIKPDLQYKESYYLIEKHEIEKVCGYEVKKKKIRQVSGRRTIAQLKMRAFVSAYSNRGRQESSSFVDQQVKP